MYALRIQLSLFLKAGGRLEGAVLEAPNSTLLSAHFLPVLQAHVGRAAVAAFSPVFGDASGESSSHLGLSSRTSGMRTMWPSLSVGSAQTSAADTVDLSYFLSRWC